MSSKSTLTFKLSVLLVAGVLLSSFSSVKVEGERLKKLGDHSCNLGLNIPDRLMTISRTEKEVVFRDRTSKAILTFTKVGLADYDFNLEANAHKLFREVKEDPKSEAIDIRRKDLSVTECFILDWKNELSGPNKKNDYFRMALIEVCGQYYNFTFSLPSKRKKDMLPIFSEILESVDEIDL